MAANTSTASNLDRRGGKGGKKGRHGGKLERLVIDEERLVEAQAPPGSRFKGYEDYVVQDLILRPHVVRFRRERWLTGDGRTVVAPLPAGIAGHFGPALRSPICAPATWPARWSRC